MTASNPRTGDQNDDALTIPPPTAGRRYVHRRRVHLADTSPKGRLRLDAAARMFQDVSDEDTTDAGFPAATWVVRRVDVRVDEFPVFREMVTVTTWCSGIGGRWAERRVRVEGDQGSRLDASVLWVHLDDAGRPAKLPDYFEPAYGEAAGGRRVRARLVHGPLPEPAPEGVPFPLRFTDYDLMDHVNNAVSWEPVEAAMAERPALRAPLRVSVEHPAPVDRGVTPRIVVADAADGFDLWLTVEGVVCSSARVRAAA